MAAQQTITHKKLYVADLIWSMASAHYTSEIPMPSEVWNNRNRIDKRSAKEIVNDIINGLGGE